MTSSPKITGPRSEAECCPLPLNIPLPWAHQALIGPAPLTLCVMGGPESSANGNSCPRPAQQNYFHIIVFETIFVWHEARSVCARHTRHRRETELERFWHMEAMKAHWIPFAPYSNAEADPLQTGARSPDSFAASACSRRWCCARSSRNSWAGPKQGVSWISRLRASTSTAPWPCR